MKKGNTQTGTNNAHMHKETGPAYSVRILLHGIKPYRLAPLLRESVVIVTYGLQVKRSDLVEVLKKGFHAGSS